MSPAETGRFFSFLLFREPRTLTRRGYLARDREQSHAFLRFENQRLAPEAVSNVKWRCLG
jgi:hypothetical protein